MSAPTPSVKAVFDRALDLDSPADRAAYLDAACAGSPDVRRKVEELLQAFAEAGDFLETPPPAGGAVGPPGPDAPGPGSEPGGPTRTFGEAGAAGRAGAGLAAGAVIAGRYTLQEKIGEGGMGEVWVAKETVPVKRRVALKVIKLGMDSRTLLARFEQERQALAVMEHPNVARVLDGGLTPTGQPFFAMELVNGLPLNKFCDEARLTLRERLRLFVPICNAVQHAHQKGIIHRDLKPANILVTLIDGRPVPKVIDFGVAKATAGGLTAESVATQFGAVVGTLEYMAPEQAGYSGADVDTRADVYSLGVILYELLAGSRPVDGRRLKTAGLAEMIRVIQEDEPPKPSTRLSTDAARASLAALRQTEPRKLTAVLRGELDWVVMKCLEKDRSRRYDTAYGLARDVERFLADEVVEARPPSTGYRLKKFVRRHKGEVTAAGLVLLALLAGITGTTWGLIEAQRHERVAKRQEDAATASAAEALAQARLARENAGKAETEARAARTAGAESKALLARAEWLVYAGKMSLAQSDFETDAGALALQYLGECQWNLRGWEHRYLWTRINAKLTLRADVGPPSGLAVRSDGKRILTGNSGDGTATVWDAETGRELLRVRHGIAVRDVAFSPDGKRVATAAGDVGRPREVKVWDAETGRELLTLTGHTGWVLGVAFSPDGTRIVTGSGDVYKPGEAKVWDAETGRELLTLTGHTGRVWVAAFSPDGTRIVTGSGDRTARVWDAATGRELFPLKGHADEVRGAAFSPDGTRIVTGSWDRTARVWDAATGRELFPLKGHTEWVLGVAFSPDGTRIVTGSKDRTVRVWDAAAGRALFPLKGHADEVSGVAFSPDGTRIVSTSDDRTTRVWDAERGQKGLTLNGHAGPVKGVAFSPDGSRLVAAGGLWDATTGRKQFALDGASGPAAFGPDGKRIVTGGQGNTARVWDAATGQEVLALSGHSGQVLGVAVSRDNTRIASAGSDATARVWDAATGREVTAIKGTARMWSVAFSPDGTRVLTGDDHTAQVWDAATGREVMALKGQPGEVWSVAYSPDGKHIVTGCLDKVVRVWDAETGRLVHTLRSHSGGVWGVALSPDGKRTFSGGEDGTVRVWDTATGHELLALKAGDGKVLSVAFSPDGNRLAAGGEDWTVKVWAAGTGQTPRTDAEFKAFLKDRLPALLREEDKPADDAERLALARVAFGQRKFALATRLWAEALAGDPRVGDDRRAAHRYTAARAAALAAAGHGLDEPPPDAAAREKLRRQALDWMTAERDACAKLIDAGTPSDWELTLYQLTGWKYDRDLAGIRDAAATADLPAEERGLVTRFWADVATLRKSGNAKHGALLRDQLPAARRALPGDSPELAHLLARIGRTHLEQEQWAEAEPVLRECLAVREKCQPDSWVTFNTYSSLGGAVLGQKRYADAEPLLLKGYHGMNARGATIPPVGKDRLAEAVDRLIDLYTATNKPVERQRWEAERAKQPEA